MSPASWPEYTLHPPCTLQPRLDLLLDNQGNGGRKVCLQASHFSAMVNAITTKVLSKSFIVVSTHKPSVHKDKVCCNWGVPDNPICQRKIVKAQGPRYRGSNQLVREGTLGVQEKTITPNSFGSFTNTFLVNIQLLRAFKL